jgi:hypothetical protein
MTQSQAEQISQTLRAVELVRARTRSAVNALWFPSIVFGGLTMASAVVAFLWGGEALGWYWPPAALLGAGVTSWFFHVRERDMGLSSRATPYLITAALMLVAAMGFGAFGTQAVQVVGPPLVVSAGCLVFAGLSRSRWLAAVAVGLAAVALVLGWLLRLPSAVWVVPLVYGSAFVIAGIRARATVERPA